jgi:hypothetical protein
MAVTASLEQSPLSAPKNGEMRIDTGEPLIPHQWIDYRHDTSRVA